MELRQAVPQADSRPGGRPVHPAAILAAVLLGGAWVLAWTLGCYLTVYTDPAEWEVHGLRSSTGWSTMSDGSCLLVLRQQIQLGPFVIVRFSEGPAENDNGEGTRQGAGA